MVDRLLYILAFVSLISTGSCAQHPPATPGNTVAPAPNYTRTSGQVRPAFLTDSQYSKANFIWLDTLTLGWQDVPRITLDLKTEKARSIGGVSLNTARNPGAEIYLPLNVHVFASKDGKTFQYMGDMMEGKKAGGDGYRVVKLVLDQMKIEARHIRLIVIPKGRFFFTDEVEVLPPGNEAALRAPLQALSSKEMDSFIDEEKEIAKERRFLLMEVEDGLKTTNPARKKQLLAVRDRINRDRQLTSSDRYEEYRQAIAATAIVQSGKEGILVRKQNSPWAPDLGKATERERTTFDYSTSMQVVTCTNATEYVAFSVFNNTPDDQRVEINYDQNSAGPELDLYTVAAVKTRKFTLEPDALIPVRNGEDLRLYPGETKILMGALRSGKPGTFSPVIRLGSAGRAAEVKLSVRVLKPVLQFQPDRRLNVDVWAYLQEPIFKGRVESARRDLVNHYVNTAVIPQHVSLSALANADPAMLNNYLKNIKGFEKILLFMNFSDYVPTVKGYFMTPGWKKKFLAGYDKAVNILKNSGIEENNIYLYPYDEVAGGEVDTYISFVKWIRSQRDNAQIFTTVIHENMAPKLKGYPDVVQLYKRDNVLKDIHSADESETWVYDIMDYSKSVPPYSRYRLLAWQAYARDLSGIGFWAYANVRGENKATAWDDFDGKTADYTVVYERGSAILPSRRWEAFRAGIEDYMVLDMYAGKFGNKEAKELCRKVLAEPENFMMADKMRTIMLEKLAKGL